jgi:hypothetical protein
MHNHTPFIINLDIHPQGYVFHSLQQPNNKQKKSKASAPKVPTSKAVNRLIKEITINSDIPPIIPEENPHSRDIHLEEAPKIETVYQEEEEDIDCEVRREGPLP